MANPPARSSLRASPAANARATALPVRCSSNRSAARAREIVAREGMNGAFNDDESTLRFLLIVSSKWGILAGIVLFI